MRQIIGEFATDQAVADDRHRPGIGEAGVEASEVVDIIDRLHRVGAITFRIKADGFGAPGEDQAMKVQRRTVGHPEPPTASVDLRDFAVCPDFGVQFGRHLRRRPGFQLVGREVVGERIR